jgi:hypothetical protein
LMRRDGDVCVFKSVCTGHSQPTPCPTARRAQEPVSARPASATYCPSELPLKTKGPPRESHSWRCARSNTLLACESCPLTTTRQPPSWWFGMNLTVRRHSITYSGPRTEPSQHPGGNILGVEIRFSTLRNKRTRILDTSCCRTRHSCAERAPRCLIQVRGCSILGSKQETWRVSRPFVSAQCEVSLLGVGLRRE